MLDFERASCLAWAFRQLADLFTADIVTITLPLMTRFAEVGITPAEPLRDRAAELALELNKISAMFFAVACAQS